VREVVDLAVGERHPPAVAAGMEFGQGDHAGRAWWGAAASAFI
jgi:hypothetical protein